MTTICTFATLEEAKSFLEKTRAEKCNDHYRSKDILIVITGIGPFAAYTATLPFIHMATHVYNLGIAGALHQEVEPWRCHTIKAVSKLSWHPKTPSFHDTIELDTNGSRLCTLDFPLYDSPIKESLQGQFDLVDMEGYALAHLCQMHNKPLTLIKVVSDYCNSKTGQDIQKNLSRLSDILSLGAP